MLKFVEFQQQKHPKTVEKLLKMVNCRDKIRVFGTIFLTRKNVLKYVLNVLNVFFCKKKHILTNPGYSADFRRSRLVIAAEILVF